jgi:hypothetical protein
MSLFSDLLKRLFAFHLSRFLQTNKKLENENRIKNNQQ